MGVATAIGLGLSAAATGAQVVHGIKQSDKAEKAMKNLKVPEFNNPDKGIKISTLGSDILKEQGQTVTANLIDNARASGARSVLGAVPKIVAVNNDINQQAAQNIDNQFTRREYAIADYEGKINNIEEGRYQSDLAGLGNLYNTGQQNIWNGIQGGLQTVSSAASMFSKKNKIKTIDVTQLNTDNASLGIGQQA